MRRNRQKPVSVLDSLIEERLLAESNELPLCAWCKEEILSEELVDSCDKTKLHRDCLIRAMVGSLGHQNQRCPCFGGIEEDPPGLTARQAATAAATKFRANLQALNEENGPILIRFK